MEGKAIELLDGENIKRKNLEKELLRTFDDKKFNEFLSELKITKKSPEELEQDRQTMSNYLEELKKENFKLEATMRAWKITLTNKLEELKEADLKLNEIHNEIRTEREEFCSKVDNFNNKYGVLSPWWEEQMNFVSDLENLKRENSEEENCDGIKQLEEEIEEIKRQIEILQAQKQITQVEINSEPEDWTFVSDGESKEDSPERLNAKKIKLSECDEIEVCEEEDNKIAASFNSLVDVEKVRMATRRRNQRRILLTKLNPVLN